MYHIGDLAWGRFQHPYFEHKWETAIWEKDGKVLAWGWVELPDYLNFLVHPDYLKLTNEIIKWFEDIATETKLTINVHNTDVQFIEILLQNGCELLHNQPFFLHMVHDLKNIAKPHLPEGFNVRPISGLMDLNKRVDIHSIVWNPSKVTEESYRNIMMTYPYQNILDWVVELSDGEFVSYCLAWLDSKNSVGLLEPVGTHPDFHRLGLSRAVCLHALQELKNQGATSAFVNPRGDKAYPIPAKLYGSLGFKSIANTKTFNKVVKN